MDKETYLEILKKSDLPKPQLFNIIYRLELNGHISFEEFRFYYKELGL